MTAIAHQPHPVTRVLAGVRDQLSAAAGGPVWSMNASDTTTAIAEVQAAEAQLAELKARLLTHADRIELAGNTGATSTANWSGSTDARERPVAAIRRRVVQLDRRAGSEPGPSRRSR